MIITIYQIFIIKYVLITIFIFSFVFSILGFLMGIMEELKFFSGFGESYLLPIILTFLNIPSLIYQVFPFIVLLSIFFLFLDLAEKNELLAFKNNGLNNFKILKLITVTTFFVGIFMITIFYHLTAELKSNYLNIKKNFTNDNKYLAAITENGLWIRDEYNNQIIFVNAKTIMPNKLIEVDMTILDKDFQYLKSIKAPEIDITNTNWHIDNATITNKRNILTKEEKLNFKTNFDFEKINNLYSDLSALSIWELQKLKKDYFDVGYSTTDIDYQFNKIFTYPIYITIISIFSVVFMVNLKRLDNKIFVLFLGIFTSVVIYYLNNFFGIIGKSEKIPLVVSIWAPLLILFMISSIGVVKINDK